MQTSVQVIGRCILMTTDAAKADYEYLYDKPYVNNKKVRVAGPFTVESLSPHRQSHQPFGR